MSAITSIVRVYSDIRDVLRASSMPHSHLRDRLAAALSLTLIVDLLASVVLYRLERNAPGTDIHTWWDSFYYVSAQLTTISSSMANPVTFAGEALCLVIDLYAITVVASVAGMFGGFFAHRTMDIRTQADGEVTE
ncbi:MAG: hypothetical protein LCH74_20640 [Proteobacteria bacterium]|nr:hypothetical protein [Pseudomonadota bacterium]